MYVSGRCWDGGVQSRCWLWIRCIDLHTVVVHRSVDMGNSLRCRKQTRYSSSTTQVCGHAFPTRCPAMRPVRPSHHHLIPPANDKTASLASNQGHEHLFPNKQPKQTDTNQQSPFPCRQSHPHPTTAFMLRLSRNPPRSSFLTSTTQCSKLSIRTRAFVSPTTS